MCTSPITITRDYPLVGIKSYTVPCGKCAECLSKKRSEIAALSLLESNHCGGTPYFLTITYDNEHCPVALSDIRGDSPVLCAFERGCFDWMRDGRFMNRVLNDDSAYYMRACSLCREDIKKWFKRFRVYYKRRDPLAPALNFRYLVFGEYGEKTGRPHYHALVYGLSREQVDFLVSCWNMGFIHVAPELSTTPTLEDITHISEYCAKYVSKGTYSRWTYLLDYAERPRRQSSIRFGLSDDDTISRLASFIPLATGFWILDDMECRALTISLFSLIGPKLSLLTAKPLPSLAL